MRVALVGATGHTGGLAVPRLLERGAEVTACGRDKDALARLAATHPGIEARVVDARDPTALDAALRDADAVLNLAGPFLATGMGVVDAARQRGIPYADTTGEQLFMRRVREAHADAGMPIVNALAFEYAFADLAARAHLPEGGDALHVLYRPRNTEASAGTRKSVLRVMATGGVGYEEGRLAPTRAGHHVRTFETLDGPRTSAWFPGGEILTVPEHTPFRTVRTYVPVKPSAARWIEPLGALARVVLRGPVLAAADAWIDRRHETPRNAKAHGEIYLDAEGPRAARVLVATPDPYEATAHACAEGILRLARSGLRGVLAPAQAFDARDFLDAMHRAMPDFVVRTAGLSSATEDNGRRSLGESGK